MQFDIGIVALVQGGNDFLPQHAGDHDVGFLGAVHLVAAQARHVEGDAADPLDLAGGVDASIDGALLAVGKRGGFLRRAKIDAAHQLAHDQDIEAGHDFRLQGRSILQRIKAQRRAQIGVHRHVLADAQQATFGALLERQAIPFGTADRTHQHGVGSKCLYESLIRIGPAGRVDRGATQQRFLGRVGQAFLTVPANHAHGGVQHFGTDTVARHQQELVFVRHIFSLTVCLVALA